MQNFINQFERSIFAVAKGHWEIEYPNQIGQIYYLNLLIDSFHKTAQ